MKRLILAVIFSACAAFAQQPVTVSTWAGGTLGAMANYGTSPGAVLVPGVNAFITNIPAVTQSGTWNVGTVTTVTAVTAITNALPAGTNVIGHVIMDTTSTTAVTQATAANLNATVVGTGTFAVQLGPVATSGGAVSRFHANTGAASNVKASAGNLYGLVLGNNGTVPCYLQVMNTAGTPTAGTGVVDSFYVQAGLPLVVPIGSSALENFATGIGIAGATTDSGATTTGCTTTLSVSAYYQ